MEELNRLPIPDLQQQLLNRYCAEARASILAAPDRAAAVQETTELCHRFGRECSSQLVVRATRQFIDEFIKARWSDDE
ncbi:MAG: hypothetical protein OEM41_07425 [Ignavibacteria bacterium]|nr:hypothetical protein [Ignavibacteria bacterium]